MKINEVSRLLHEEKKLFKANFFQAWIKLNFLEKKLNREFQISGKNSVYNVTKKIYQESIQKIYIS